MAEHFSELIFVYYNISAVINAADIQRYTVIFVKRIPDLTGKILNAVRIYRNPSRITPE